MGIVVTLIALAVFSIVYAIVGQYVIRRRREGRISRGASSLLLAALLAAAPLLFTLAGPLNNPWLPAFEAAVLFGVSSLAFYKALK
jgi:hypothetical protein